MLDLAARVFYKAHFDIVRETEDLELLRDVIVADLSEWLKRKYRGSIRYWNWAQLPNMAISIPKTTDYLQAQLRLEIRIHDAGHVKLKNSKTRQTMMTL